MNASHLWALGLAGCIAVLQSAAGAPMTPVQTQDELACGPLKAHVRSVWLTFQGEGSPASQLLEQRLSLSVQAGAFKAVQLDSRLLPNKIAGGQRVLDAALTGWACLDDGKSPPYLLLAYSCVEGEERGECAGNAREWTHLYDSRGRPLTAGFKRKDSRQDRFYRAQGLQEIMRRGVSLTGLSR